MLRLQWLSSCCLGSNSTVKLWHPPQRVACSVTFMWVVLVSGLLCLADWSAFVQLSMQKQSLAEGLGGGVNTIPFVPAAVSCEEREVVHKASFSAWERRLVIVLVWPKCSSEYIGHPALTHSWPLAPFMTLLMYIRGGSQCLLKLNVDSLNAVFYQWHYATKLSHLCFCLTYKVAIPLSEPCPLFCRSCQKCQPYLLSFRPSWRVEEQEKEGGSLNECLLCTAYQWWITV